MATRLRRTSNDPRLELMPLLDVIFLLLTFFIYAMVLTVRAKVLPVELPALSAGEAAGPVEAVSITMDEAGALYLDAQPVAMESLLERLRGALDEKPGARVYLAAAREGRADRLPRFLDVVNVLRGSGLDEFYVVGE